jgi:hypothetical protein
MQHSLACGTASRQPSDWPDEVGLCGCWLLVVVMCRIWSAPPHGEVGRYAMPTTKPTMAMNITAMRQTKLSAVRRPHATVLPHTSQVARPSTHKGRPCGHARQPARSIARAVMYTRSPPRPNWALVIGFDGLSAELSDMPIPNSPSGGAGRARHAERDGRRHLARYGMLANGIIVFACGYRERERLV